MVFIIRLIVVFIFSIILCILGTLYCLFNPKKPENVYIFGQWFGKLQRVFGLKVSVQGLENKPKGSCIYVANHQSNFDLIIASPVFQRGTVTVGKKSLFWVPFFGLLYWLTGNLLIDRDNKNKAHGTIAQIAKFIKEKNISIWMFPEGTRNGGGELLPFKNGAFHAAILAGVPVVPVCISSSKNIKLNKWNNGHILIEMLPAIDTSTLTRGDVRTLSTECRQRMREGLDKVNSDVKKITK